MRARRLLGWMLVAAFDVGSVAAGLVRTFDLARGTRKRDTGEGPGTREGRASRPGLRDT